MGSTVLNLGDRFEFAKREAADPWLHSLSATGWEQTFDKLTSQPFNGLTTEALLGPIQVLFEKVEAPFSYSGCSRKDSRVFVCYQTLGESGPLYDLRTVSCERVISHSWDSVDRILSKHPTCCAVVVIDQSYLKEFFRDIKFEFEAAESGRATVVASDSGSVKRFKSTVSRVLTNVETSPHLLDSLRGRTYLQGMVMEMLVEILTDKLDSDSRLPAPTTRSYVVGQAISFMEPRLADPITTADLCREIGVSSRTLRYSFETVMGTSPMKYLLDMRLNCVRRDLLASGGNVEIQAIAAHWGFNHMGHFARYYRRCFGETPSKTACRFSGISRGRMSRDSGILRKIAQQESRFSPHERTREEHN